nr:Sec-independent protein translocase subunit TatA [Actinomycetales bacterium]
MGKLSAWQIIILVVIVLVIFGSARLPQVAESLGKSLKIFKREVKELREDDAAPSNPPSALPPTSSTAAPPYPTTPPVPGQMDPDNPPRSL